MGKEKTHKPSEKGYNDLSRTITDNPRTWPALANNFLFKFFEGRSWSIWLFISGFLTALYQIFVPIEDGFFRGYPVLSWISVYSLFLLIGLIFLRNLVNNFPPLAPTGLRLRLWLHLPYKFGRWYAAVLDQYPRKRALTLPVKNLQNFKMIVSSVNIVDAGDGRWRAGFYFGREDGQREYIFHVYQDKESSGFHARIVEREPGVREISPDRNKQFIGIENTREFTLSLERDNGDLNFYVDGIHIGKYKVPLEVVTNVSLAAWSDDQPIAITFEDTDIYV